MNPARADGSLRRWTLVLVGALLLQVYAPTLLKLVEHWSANDMYSYAYAVPLISIGMLWIRRAELAATPVAPRLASGTIVLAAGISMLLAGRASSTNVIEELSLVASVSGLMLLLFGWKMLRATAFPIVYLLAMIPFWDFLTARVHPLFQLYSAAVGVTSLRLMGIPVLRDGFMIELPYNRLEVAEACSGVNYLIAVLCIGVAATYLFVRGWPRRIFIVATAVLIAVLSNGLRVAMVALFAYAGLRGPNGDIHGPYALLRSLLISGIGYAVLFALIAKFSDASSRMAPAAPAPRTPVPPPFGQAVTALATAIVLLCMPATLGAVRQVTSVPVQRSLSEFPARIGAWHAEGPATFSSEIDSLQFDQKLCRVYRSADGTEVTLLIGYFEKQNQGRELAGFDFRTSLVGADRSILPLPTADGVAVNHLRFRGAAGTFHAAYWYSVAGRAVAEAYKTKLYTAWNSLVHGRSNGSLVFIRARASDHEPLDATRRRVGEFAALVMAVSSSELPR